MRISNNYLFVSGTSEEDLKLPHNSHPEAAVSKNAVKPGETPVYSASKVKR